MSDADHSPNNFRELDGEFLKQQARIWLEAVLGQRFDQGTSLADLLADGEILHKVSSIIRTLLHRQAEGKLTFLKSLFSEASFNEKHSGKYLPYSNVDAFLKVCQELGLTGVDLFSPPDVVEKRDIRRVCWCIRGLSKKARAKQLQVPNFDYVTHTATMPTGLVGGLRESLTHSSNSTPSGSGSWGTENKETPEKVRSSPSLFKRPSDAGVSVDSASLASSGSYGETAKESGSVDSVTDDGKNSTGDNKRKESLTQDSNSPSGSGSWGTENKETPEKVQSSSSLFKRPSDAGVSVDSAALASSGSDGEIAKESGSGDSVTDDGKNSSGDNKRRESLTQGRNSPSGSGSWGTENKETPEKVRSSSSLLKRPSDAGGSVESATLASSGSYGEVAKESGSVSSITDDGKNSTGDNKRIAKPSNSTSTFNDSKVPTVSQGDTDFLRGSRSSALFDDEKPPLEDSSVDTDRSSETSLNQELSGKIPGTNHSSLGPSDSFSEKADFKQNAQNRPSELLPEEKFADHGEKDIGDRGKAKWKKAGLSFVAAALALVGAVLVIRAREPVSYEVQKGDTLIQISRRTGKSNWEELVRLNPEIRNPDLIYPGERLRLRT